MSYGAGDEYTTACSAAWCTVWLVLGMHKLSGDGSDTGGMGCGIRGSLGCRWLVRKTFLLEVEGSKFQSRVVEYLFIQAERRCGQRQAQSC